MLVFGNPYDKKYGLSGHAFPSRLQGGLDRVSRALSSFLVGVATVAVARFGLLSPC